jgi:hypothetical protein
MRDSFPIAFKLTMGLEGRFSDDPDDPGNYYPDGSPGFTIYGLCTRYNKGLRKDMTLDEAMDRYLTDYWVPAGCDKVPFPMDICLFDSQVNPQNDKKFPWGGNQEILNLGPENWQEYNLMRMIRYTRNSKKIYVNGHINRVLILSEKIMRLRRGL